MTRLKITFEVETECDASEVLAAQDEKVGESLDGGHYTQIIVDTDSISVEAMSPILIQMTYSIVTPESAEYGEDSDHGFAEPGGWTYSVIDQDFQNKCKEVGDKKALADATPVPESFDTVADAVEFLASYGPLEPSDSALGPHTWLTQTESSDMDGEILSFHFKHGLNPYEATEQARATEVIAEVLST